MQALLDERDYQIITAEVIKRLEEKFTLVPNQNTHLDDWVGIQEFTNSLPVKKDKEWVRMFILSLPEFKNWVINLNAGSGHPTKVNKTKGMAWVRENQADIDWKQSLPR